MQRRDLACTRMATSLGLLFLLACAAATAKDASADARVHVTWAPAAALSEVKDNPGDRGWMNTQEWQKRLTDYIVRRADKLLPTGQTLDVKINDIKLAGGFEPWRGPSLQDVRYMKNIYWPRAEVSFKLIAADGATLREGTKKLSDMAYLQRPLTIESDVLGYDKRMFGDWLYAEFGKNKT